MSGRRVTRDAAAAATAAAIEEGDVKSRADSLYNEAEGILRDGSGENTTRHRCQSEQLHLTKELRSAASNARKRTFESVADATREAKRKTAAAAAAAAVVSALTAEPPSILTRLLEELSDVFVGYFLPVLDAADRTLLAQVGRQWRAAVMSSGLGRAGVDARDELGREIRLNVKAFVDSVQRLAWARSNGVPWSKWTAMCIAQVGNVEVLKWARGAREIPCIPWDEHVCAQAAGNGHIDVLQYARDQGCDWDQNTCASAAGGGHLELLQWARAQGCEWTEACCAKAAKGGHLHVLKWAHEAGAPWDKSTW